MTSLIVVLILLFIQQGEGRILKVPEMFSDIQEGINAAQWGDIVKVGPGIFQEHIYIKNGVEVQGAGKEQTVIEGYHQQPVVIMEGESKLKYCTIRNSNFYPGFGIYCTRATPLIEGNIITRNKWGIGCFLAAPQIIDNDIFENSIEGLHCVASYPTIINNRISRNGDGAYFSFCFSTLLRNNEIDNNRYTGVYCLHSSPTIVKNTIAGNGYVNILCNKFSTPVIHQNSIYDARFYNVELYNNSFIVDARNNYWGTTIENSILEKIWDGNDQGNLGKVKIYPWYGTESAALNAPLSDYSLPSLQSTP